MKSRSLTNRAVPAAAFCGLALALYVLPSRAQADMWDKKTIFTINQPVQVQDTYLEAGTYVFTLASSSSNRNIVQIFDRDQKHLIKTFLAIPEYRLEPTSDSRFVFYETPAGTTHALRTWFYPGENYGQMFRYPKHLRQIAQVTPIPSAPVPEPAIVADARLGQPEPMPAEPSTAPAAEPVVAAAAETGSAPEAAAEPEPAPAEQLPAELPKTATPSALIGLCSLLSLAAYRVLRAD
jgi:hypothetical protein